MPAGARRSLASPVVSGVLCQCGGDAAATTSTSTAAGQLPANGAASSPVLEHERRFHSLFLLLDVNRDGALCIHDLAVGLGRLGLHRSERDLWTLEALLSFVFSCVSAVTFQHVSCVSCLLMHIKKYGQLSSTINYRGWCMGADPVQNLATVLMSHRILMSVYLVCHFCLVAACSLCQMNCLVSCVAASSLTFSDTAFVFSLFEYYVSFFDIFGLPYNKLLLTCVSS